MEGSKTCSEKQQDKEFQVTDQTTSLSRRNIVTVFLTCSIIDFAAIIDQNTLSVSLPIIGASLGASNQVSSIAAAYFITSTSFQLLYGRLSDIWSRKHIIVAGLALFFVGSLGSSFATSITHLIIFRALTGIGGGGLVTLVQIVVGDVVSLRERGKWQGIIGSVVALSHGISPIIGSKIASYSPDSWRWIFRLSLFTSIVTTLMVVFFLPLKKVDGNWKKKVKTVDFLGMVLTLAASSLIILGLTWGGVMYPWLSVHVIVTLILGAFSAIVFLIWEWKGALLPLLPRKQNAVFFLFQGTALKYSIVSIFNSRMVQATTTTTFISGWNYLVQTYFIPSFYQLAYGYAPTRAASMLLPIILLQTASSTLGGLIVSWRGRYRESLIFGYTLWSVGLGLHCLLTPSSSLAMQLGYGFLLGFGTGQCFQPSLIAMQAAVGKEHMAIITGVRSYLRDLGGTLGLAITGSILNRMLLNAFSYAATNKLASLSSEQIQQILRNPTLLLTVTDTQILEKADMIKSLTLAAYFKGFRLVFILSTSLGILSILVTILFIPQVELKVEKIQNEKEVESSQVPV
ncbi:Efflux pump FUS6 [Erysiphe neolycopersici]|uniref:Efflux pump FUS6 n=1 Tax=Erysiphe neolycopersici TaxID=212602 RepID=A0A420HQF1_9PEZI|nr:Efflux pump FUS6 [Erysiphe neolycopersici]